MEYGCVAMDTEVVFGALFGICFLIGLFPIALKGYAYCTLPFEEYVDKWGSSLQRRGLAARRAARERAAMKEQLDNLERRTAPPTPPSKLRL